MLEAGHVVLLHISAPGAVEVLQCPVLVAAVDAGSRFCELAIGGRGHGGNDRNAFVTIRSHTRARFASSVGLMDEARAVMWRLRRIESLEREHAPPEAMLAEVHELLAEADTWISAERVGTERAEEALARCRAGLATGASVTEEVLSTG